MFIDECTTVICVVVLGDWKVVPLHITYIYVYNYMITCECSSSCHLPQFGTAALHLLRRPEAPKCNWLVNTHILNSTKH